MHVTCCVSCRCLPPSVHQSMPEVSSMSQDHRKVTLTLSPAHKLTQHHCDHIVTKQSTLSAYNSTINTAPTQLPCKRIAIDILGEPDDYIFPALIRVHMSGILYSRNIIMVYYRVYIFCNDLIYHETVYLWCSGTAPSRRDCFISDDLLPLQHDALLTR